MSVRAQLERLSRESVVYGVGQVAGRAVNLLLVPVLTRALLKQEFGVSDLVLAYAQNVLLVLVLGMDGALARFFYEQPDRDARVRMASTSLAFRIATGTLAAAAFALAARPLAAAFLHGAVYAKYLRIGAAALPFTLIVLYCNDVLRVTFQPWKFVALNVAWAAAVGGLTIGLVIGRHLGVAGVLYGKLAGDAIAAGLGLVLVRHNLRPRLGAGVLRTMLGYGLPLVPVAFAYGVIGTVDVATLQRFGSLDDVATYRLAMRFFTVLNMGVWAFQLAFMPFAFARARDPDAPRLFARVLGLYVALGSLGALAAGLLAPAGIALLATRAYASSALPAMWLGFAAVAQGAYYVAALGINLSRRNALLGWAAGGAAALAAAANLLLVPRWGAEGAAIASFAGYTASAVLTYVIAQRVWPLPFRGARLAALFAIAVALGAATVRLAPPGAAGAGVRLAAAAAFALLAWRSEVWKDRGAVRHRPAAG